MLVSLAGIPESCTTFISVTKLIIKLITILNRQARYFGQVQEEGAYILPDPCLSFQRITKTQFPQG